MGGALLTAALLQSVMLQSPMVVAAASESANEIVVNPGQLQAALDSANPGDRILLNPGTYSESITVRRGGEAGTPITITRASANTPVMTGPWVIRAPHVTASRLIFDGSAFNDYPIRVSQADGAYGSYFTLERCEVRDALLSGLFVGDTSPPMPLQGVVVRDCYFHDNGDSASHDHGIYIKSGSNHLIEGNLIVRSSGLGIQNYPHARGVVIRGNEIRENGAGILVEHDLGDQLPMVNHTLVDSNYVKDNRGMGISLMYAGDVSLVPPGIANTVSNNWAEGNVGGQYGGDGALGHSNYTRGATWSGNVYGGPTGGVVVPLSSVGPGAGTGGSSASEIVVNPGQLQAALDSANPGDRILLNPGTYPESITVRRGGEAGTPITITRASANTPVMTGPWVIRAPHVTASRLIFDGSAYNDYPIWAASAGGGIYASNFTLEECEVRDSRLSGIFVGDTSPPMPLQGVVVRDCYFHDNGDSASHDHGIFIKSGSNHRIRRNLIVRSSGLGIYNSPHAQGLVIRRNEIRQNGAGILIEHRLGDEVPMVNHTLVGSNYVKDNRGMGISLMYAGNLSLVPPGIANTVSNNWAEGNVGGQYGRDGALGNSPYTRGATWSGNVHGPAPANVLPHPLFAPDAP